MNTNPNLQDILDELMRLGFSAYEAKAYIALMQSPSVTAYEVSKLSGVPQSKIYETMKKIVDKGLAIAEGTKPVTFIALSIDEFLDRYRADLNKSLDFLRDNVKAIGNQPSLEYIWHFNGSLQLMNKIRSLISDAQSSLYLEIWADEYRELLDDLKEARDRGIKIAAVVYGVIPEEVGKVYYHAMDALLENEARSGRWLNIIRDNQECCFGIFNQANPSGIWTQNDSLMLLSKSFISHDIMIAEIYSRFKDLLDAEYGENMIRLRQSLAFR